MTGDNRATWQLIFRTQFGLVISQLQAFWALSSQISVLFVLVVVACVAQISKLHALAQIQSLFLWRSSPPPRWV